MSRRSSSSLLITATILLSSMEASGGFSMRKEQMASEEIRTHEISEKTINDQWMGRVPPRLSHTGPIIFGDFLYWHADEDGLEYAIKSSSAIYVPMFGSKIGRYPEQHSKSRLKEIDFTWNPGFRLGLGYVFGTHDHWDLFLTYTFYRNHTKDETHAPNGGILYPLWTPLLGSEATKAHAHWDLGYQTIDLDLGRSYFISTMLSIRPYVGLRAAYIDQKFRCKYDLLHLLLNPSDGSFVRTEPGASSFKATNDFAGFGLKAGTDFMFHFNQYVSAFAQISACLLYGGFTISQRSAGEELYGLLVPFGPVQYYANPITNSFHHNNHRTRANIQMLLGLEFETTFSKGRRNFSFMMGYEFLEWFRQNNLSKAFIQYLNINMDGVYIEPPSFITDTQNGDLALRGLTMNMRVDF